MRSIGKRNIKKLKQIVIEEHAHGGLMIDERIRTRIPHEWYDIWESAWDEIERVINDTLFIGR